MKKFSTVIFTCIILLSIPQWAAGEDTMGLTKQQLYKYNESKLTVTAYALVSSAGGAAPATANPASLLWAATLGYEAIPEWDFLRIVGYPEEAEKSRKQTQLVNITAWGGMGVALVGTALLIIPLLDLESEKSLTSRPLFWGGAATWTIGFSSTIYSMFLPSGNITPVGRAYSMAEEYNGTLVRTIRDN